MLGCGFHMHGVLVATSTETETIVYINVANSDENYFEKMGIFDLKRNTGCSERFREALET